MQTLGSVENRDAHCLDVSLLPGRGNGGRESLRSCGWRSLLGNARQNRFVFPG